MIAFSQARVQTYRARTFRTAAGLRLASEDEAVDFVNQRGFVFFWPIKGYDFPNLWMAAAGDRPVPDEHDDPGHVTWSWKDSLLGARRWYYGRVLRQRNAMISLETLPYFYALTNNYGDPENDYQEQYLQGTLTLEAKSVYEALLESGPLDTIALRKAARLSSRESDSRFNKALNDLQMDFKVLPIGISPVGAWRYAFIYELSHRHFPDLIEQASHIFEGDARQTLAEITIQSLGATPDTFIARLFRWNKDEMEKCTRRLLSSGKYVCAPFPGQEQNWIGLTELVEFHLNRKGVIMFEFHISRQARDRYQFDQTLFNLQGNVIFANFHAARLFAQKMNQARDLVTFPEQAIRAGQINAMGLIDEILHQVVFLYRQEKNPQIMVEALAWLQERVGAKELDRTLIEFTYDFPPLAVYRKQQTTSEYLDGKTEGISNRTLVLEEMLMLWVANLNPACEPYQELFNDDHLSNETAYKRVASELNSFFDTQPGFGPESQNLVAMLRAPAIAVPHSLTGQLEYIRTHWADLLGRYLYRLLASLDLVKEEERLYFSGPGPVPIPMYDRSLLKENEPEKFSQDKEWMPRLVLMAKNSFVWLDQLSKKYQRPITKLDQIPDEELDNLARWGFTGLWLIGLWERSTASARVKQLCGNPEAIASAYSLAGYWIANDLGGEQAYQNLHDRAWQRGIRLASDMVPNHMGIDSQWVVDHPDWFLSLDYCPYPSYSFNGPDLSPDGRVSINIEDHYFDRSDAAVVFKRYDHSNGDTRFIYHGNDGTSMPWNDTAQLNYLNPDVREAVIQTILSVARRFPIIRFDAAMTLAKRHFQRLWYPEPGTGGAIPSRAEHGMTKDQFDAAMPIEFWREVVDRAAVEAPDTLLLAEAFWLMESYFVRTLGMHRVYNSAFMNLLRNEENDKYRTVMKNTLEFDPEILKRFVNFMNNPDERTAVDQFGKGDKYFGICTLMATLPGLPMFGHGQIEGFTEKYGMEFRKAYWEEQIDQNLVERHQREIFPLLHRRALFAGVEHFLLFDFFSPDGFVNEDVYAYANGLGSERTLVVYNNKFADAHGWIRISVGFSVKTPGSDQRQNVQRTLGEGLGITPGQNSLRHFPRPYHPVGICAPGE